MDISALLIAVIVAVALALLFLLRVYNQLVAMRNNVRNAWSDIDVQLTFRHNLVPNLVESVQGYMSHERETLEAVARARSAAMKAGADVAIRTVAGWRSAAPSGICSPWQSVIQN